MVVCFWQLMMVLRILTENASVHDPTWQTCAGLSTTHKVCHLKIQFECLLTARALLEFEQYPLFRDQTDVCIVQIRPNADWLDWLIAHRLTLVDVSVWTVDCLDIVFYEDRLVWEQTVTDRMFIVLKLLFQTFELFGDFYHLLIKIENFLIGLF